MAANISAVYCDREHRQITQTMRDLLDKQIVSYFDQNDNSRRNNKSNKKKT